MNPGTSQSMDEIKYWVALNMVLGVGKTLFHRLTGEFGSPEQVFRVSRKELMRVEGIGDKTATEIAGFSIEEKADRELRLLEKIQARIVTLVDPEYPELLRQIFDPPPLLYCQGNRLDSYPIPIAVVGTRAATSYGKMVTESLCAGLAERGATIVSGMARGIDTIAHRSALQSGGDTVAVFGCGLSHTYPPENRSLRDKIAQAGTVVSEFPISMRPDRNNFPARNRIISGLSYGVIVVEAGEKSGALITVQFALEQGRDVFAVPGSILSPKSFSPNRLIKAGAKLVDGPESILEELPSAVQGLITQRSEKIGIKQELSEKEQSIVSLIIGEEKHIDQLIENSRLSPAEVSATLVQLELSGIVRQLEGKMFIATIKTVSNK
jgi:DNA processing protein